MFFLETNSQKGFELMVQKEAHNHYIVTYYISSIPT